MTTVPVGLAQAQVLDRKRRVRKPKHSFLVRHKPFTIQPFMCAPVLPGETLRNVLLQSRAVSDPIRNALTGWWLEYYIFYVKLTQLDHADFRTFLLDPSVSINTGHTTASNAKYYHNGNTVSWPYECLKVCVAEYFRLEGQAWNVVTIDGMPAAGVNTQSGLDSLTASSLVEGATIEQTISTAGDNAFTASEWEQAWLRYSALREMNLATYSWQDFIASYGVKTPEPEEDTRPELIRYLREWQYPSNTVEPTTGVPSSAVSWSIQERADKDRFFKEPGFVFGVTVARPKVYYGGQRSALTSLMSDAWRWLPAVLENQPGVSLVESASGAGPVSLAASNYYIDVRDILEYGDQFLNVDVTTVTDASVLPALPSTALQKHYPAEADVDDLFTQDPVTTKGFVRQDGVCQLTISTRQMDVTRST